MSMAEILRPLGALFNQAGYLANADIFTSDLEVVAPPTLLKINCCFNAGAVLSIVIGDGTNQETCLLNSGNALVANALYEFEMLIAPGQIVNFTYAINCEIKIFTVVI